jgi:outer membrane protein assembly factor BamB
LNLADGRLLWEYDGVGGSWKLVRWCMTTKVIFGAWSCCLYALDTRTGQLVWSWHGDKPGTLLSPAAVWPVTAHGKVFIVAPDRKMTALEARTGRQIWRTGDYVVRESIGLSEDGERFYVRAMNDFIYALATRPDQPEKVGATNAKFGYDINSAMLVEKEGVLFYGTKNGLLFALDARTGAVRWQHKLGTGVMNTVVP